eukprot:TRINITY_DN166_c1_g1_i2.p1 TRINITY_DN166_c1_g1~~TRINITY_DN166_c1_g1_i2.p1  ORF type:complete len:489 (-),score=39.73 TRINITY_DN166_c1_g1_i2:362-1828(-)
MHKVGGGFYKQIGDYLIGRTIGQGSYAKVKYGQHKDTHEPVAIKVLEKAKLVESKMVEQIKKEISIMKVLKHPYIVDLKEVLASKEKIYMIMELVPGGELYDLVIRKGPQSEGKARQILQQLMDALDYCHLQGIYHRDLKPENVLLSSNGDVKLSDFGLGSLPESTRGPDGQLQTTCGTPNYVAPEVLRRKGYKGAPADVWSLGVVLYVITAAALPFDEPNVQLLFRSILRGQFDLPHHFSPELKDLLRKMICIDPEQRISISEMREHPWVKIDYNPPFVEALSATVLNNINAMSSEIFNHESPLYDISTDEQHQIARLSGGELGDPSSSIPRNINSINAFDLINSALDLSMMFERSADVITRHTRFISAKKPKEIMDRILEVASGLECRTQRISDYYGKLATTSNKGLIMAIVDIFEVEHGTYLVEFSKGQGDYLQFAKLFMLIQRHAYDVVTKAQAIAGITVDDNPFYKPVQEISEVEKQLPQDEE